MRMMFRTGNREGTQGELMMGIKSILHGWELFRKEKKNKKKEASSSYALGSANSSGAWYVPFTSIFFVL